MNRDKYLYKKIIDIVIVLILLISIAGIIVMLGELIIRKDLIQIIIWLVDNKIAVLLNILLIFMGVSIGTILTKNIGKGSLIIGVVYISICILNYYKYCLKGEFIVLYDFKLGGEATNIIKNFNIQLENHIIICVIVFVILCYMAWKIEFKYDLKKLITGVVVFLIIIVTIIKIIYFNKNILKDLGINQDPFFDKKNYVENGLAVTLITKIPDVKIKKPNNYSSKEIQKLVDKYYKQENNKLIKPNVIMIMNEAFFDITKIPEIALKEDPLKKFHTYQDSAIKGNIISSVFGGGTAQTEYEVLTGNMVDFIGSANIAYINYINNETESIVEIFDKQGYSTLALHPYLRNFYRRDKVYRDLGFDKYISIEEIEKLDDTGTYISDQDAYRKLIQEYEIRKNNNPLFAHIVTMQNHAPYNRNLEEDYIMNKNLSKTAFDEVNGYIEGLRKSDDGLEYLINYFKKIEQPTIIVFYGDHAPLLDSFYIDMGVTTQEQMDQMESFELYTVPLLIWSNYDLPSKDYGYVDASYVGDIVLDLVGINEYPYYQMLEQMMNNIGAYNYKFLLDKNKKYLKKDEINEEQKKFLDELWMLQYDRIFGENYIERSNYE